MVMFKIAVTAVLGVLMISRWSIAQNVGELPPLNIWIKHAIITLTSILFIQALSPNRAYNKSIAAARYKTLQTINITSTILFVTFAMSHADAVQAYNENISALAIAAKVIPGKWTNIAGILLNIFAVMTAFFGIYLGFREATQGILRRYLPEDRISEKWVKIAIIIAAISLAWSAIVLNLPVLLFTSLCSPIFGLVGCLIPAYLVYKVPSLHRFKGIALCFIIFTELLLVISPFLKFIE